MQYYLTKLVFLVALLESKWDTRPNRLTGFESALDAPLSRNGAQDERVEEWINLILLYRICNTFLRFVGCKIILLANGIPSE